jgi:type IV fimbrial biogenesis protein FimT
VTAVLPWSVSRQQRGFTLVELLTVVAVMAVVTTLAAPGMRSFGLSQKARTVSHDLVSDLLVARSEALKRNREVTVQPLQGGWTEGWSVNAEELRLVTRQIEAGSLAFDGTPQEIRFNVWGRIAGPATTLRITLGPADPQSDASRRCIDVDPSGYARSTVGAC